MRSSVADRFLGGLPGTRHDDQVDSTTQALNHIRSDKRCITG
jgi:phage terminase large subunit-like protein